MVTRLSCQRSNLYLYINVYLYEHTSQRRIKICISLNSIKGIRGEDHCFLDLVCSPDYRRLFLLILKSGRADDGDQIVLSTI